MSCFLVEADGGRVNRDSPGRLSRYGSYEEAFKEMVRRIEENGGGEWSYDTGNGHSECPFVLYEIVGFRPERRTSMAKKKFFVNVSTTMSTDVVIVAESEEEAIEIARDLCFNNDDFCADVADSFSNDYEAYRPKNWDFTCYGLAGDDMEADNEEE